MKLNEEQLLKLNTASGLMADVRAQLLRRCEALPDGDPEKTAWTPLFQVECKLNVLMLHMKQN